MKHNLKLVIQLGDRKAAYLLVSTLTFPKTVLAKCWYRYSFMIKVCKLWTQTANITTTVTSISGRRSMTISDLDVDASSFMIDRTVGSSPLESWKSPGNDIGVAPVVPWALLLFIY